MIVIFVPKISLVKINFCFEKPTLIDFLLDSYYKMFWEVLNLIVDLLKVKVIVKIDNDKVI